MSLSPLVGQRYRLLSPLGRGGMGTVYRAYDRLMGDEVALKRVHTETPLPQVTGGSLDVRLALAREFQALATLHHPNLIAVRDYGFDLRVAAEGDPPAAYFTMELLTQPRALLDAGRGQPLEPQMALILQLLRALDYVHRRGIVHRDLKPSNVLVVPNGSAGPTVKVLDFGLATLAGQEDELAGTLYYMAPEILRGAAISPAADLYAVGVLAYELIAGHHPFQYAADQDMVMAILTREPAWEAIPPALREPLGSLLDKDPDLRPADALTALTALSAALGNPLPAETHAIRESFLQAAPFVSRQAELGQLLDTLRAVQTGASAGWLIGGESGVGKSRLVDEVRIQALVAGAAVLVGQAASDGGGPFHLWREAARWLALLANPTDFEASVLTGLAADLSDLLERPIAPPPALPPQAAQTRLFSTIIELLKRVTAQRPIVIALADVHWADANSLDLLGWVQRLQLPSVLILGDYRNDEAPRLPEAFGAMRTLLLTRLTQEGVAHLARSMLGPASVDDDLVQFLWRESEGNTFFIVEVVRALADEAGQLAHVARMTLPARVFGGGIQRVVARRLRRASADDRAWLEVAAVAGRRVNPDLLNALGLAETRGWLIRCAEMAVLEAQDENWRFAHDKLREGLLDGLAAPARQSLHQRVAEALERLYTDALAPRAAELAYHFGEAGDLAAEARFAALAGEHAAAQYANAEALTFLSRALDLTPETDHDTRWNLVRRREQVYGLLGQREAQSRAIDDLLALAAQHASAEWHAYATLRAAYYAELTSAYVTALEHARHATAQAQTLGHRALEAEARLLAGLVLWRQGDFTAAKAELPRALALARAAQLRPLEAEALRNIAILHDYAEERDTAYDLHQQALTLFTAIGDRSGEARVCNNLGTTERYRDHIQASLAFYRRSQTVARLIGDLAAEYNVTSNLCLTQAEFGDLEASEQTAPRLMERARANHDPKGEGIILINLALTALNREQWARAKDLSEQAITIFKTIGAQYFVITAANLYGEALYELGDYAQSRHVYAETLRLEAEASAETLAGLARAELALGHATEARALLQRIPDLPNTAREVMWVVYEIFHALGDAQAQPVLALAYHTLQATAAQLEADLRFKFLANLRENRRILAAWEEHR